MNVNIWFSVSAFLAGIVVTLLGAWATHSVTKQDLMTAIGNQNAVYSTQLASLQQLIEVVSKGQDRLWKKLDEIESRMAARRFGDSDHS